MRAEVEGVFNCRGNCVGQLRCGAFRTTENRIAALDIGFDVGESERFQQRGKLLHRQLVIAADVHAAEQGDPDFRTRHRLAFQ